MNRINNRGLEIAKRQKMPKYYEAVIQTVSILNKSDYLKFYFRINI